MVRQRKASLKVVARNQELLEQIKAIKAEHPFWGYRRVWAWLVHYHHLQVNQKRVYRLMKEHDLLVGDNTKLKAKRSAYQAKPKPTRPNQWWGIDMTKVMVGHTGWAYVTVVLDWFTKKVVGYHIGLQSKTRHWLEALNQGLNNQFPNGVLGNTLNLMSDNGSQPTSTTFIKTCSQLGIKQAFTSYNNPKGNADTERFMRTMKEECLWLREWNSLNQLTQSLSKWFEHYNRYYLHSSLGYQSPLQMEKSHDTLLKIA
jgi:putative transposase